MIIRELARAKVNLALHVVGQRNDGYHLLDSLVVFPEIGDVVEVEPSSELSLTIGGRFAQDLGAGEDNLVLRAAETIRPQAQGAAIHLTKSLPIASGIGGGSADAAATLRALSRLWSVPIERSAALSLGADVPVCLESRTCRMQGIGEIISPFQIDSDKWLVLVNPDVQLSTPAVFNELATKDGAAMNMELPVSDQRNDLEPGAIRLQPVIGEVLLALRASPGCEFARMSGSGATCFGMYDDEDRALNARAEIANANPLWWCVAAPVLNSGDPLDHEIGEIRK